jgi:hypothetical protein
MAPRPRGPLDARCAEGSVALRHACASVPQGRHFYRFHRSICMAIADRRYAEAPSRATSKRPKTRPPRPMHDFAAIEGALVSLLDADPPLTADQVAEACGRSKVNLRQFHGNLMRRLAARSREYTRTRSRLYIYPILEAALTEDPPPSMEEINRRVAVAMGCRRTGLARMYYGELCKAIAARCELYRSESASNRLGRIRTTIEAAVSSIRQSGGTPNIDRVMEIVAPGGPRSYTHAKIYQDVMRSDH